MSAIAHWLEQQGLATVVIGLVHLHLTKMKPPRALWVPFELGRPLGPPLDVEFQRDVLHTALSLIEADAPAGGVTDYSIDDPNTNNDSQWKAPVLQACTTIVEEVEMLRPAYDVACRRFDRSSVGVAKTAIQASARLVDSYISGAPIAPERSDISTTLALRLALDDLRAYYTESAGSNGLPSSDQLYTWYWSSTYAGHQIMQLKALLATGSDEKLKALAEKFIVPRAYQRS